MIAALKAAEKLPLRIELRKGKFAQRKFGKGATSVVPLRP